MSLRPLLLSTLLFAGLTAVFGSLTLSARGLLAPAAGSAAAGAAAVVVAAWMLARQGGGA